MNIFCQYSILNTFINPSSTTGLVPTMGALHEGHVSLIKKAICENQQVIVSIFINPTQFENFDDLKKYPETLKADVKIIESISKKILIYTPDTDDLYSKEIKSLSYNFGAIEGVMEGEIRKNHFQGVATIVEKLLNIFMPENAYFGEKDFQQLQIIRLLVAQKKISSNIIGCSTFRNKDGLALSSRNSFLTNSEREKASFIHQQLLVARSLWGIENPKTISEKIKKSFSVNRNFKLDYFDIRFEVDLSRATKKSKKKVRAFVAAKIGKTRLIDNLALYEI
jgi:pantoate--beta-alanine ligase